MSGRTVYSYVNNNPLTMIDPSGFDDALYQEDGGAPQGGGAPIVLPEVPSVGTRNNLPPYDFGRSDLLNSLQQQYAPSLNPLPSGELDQVVVLGHKKPPPTVNLAPNSLLFSPSSTGAGAQFWEKPTQCINSDGSIGNDPSGTLSDPNVIYAGFDLEGYLLGGGGAHVGGFYDRSTGNFGAFGSIDFGGGFGGSGGFSVGVASRLSSFQGATSVLGGGLFFVAATYTSQAGDPT